MGETQSDGSGLPEWVIACRSSNALSLGNPLPKFGAIVCKRFVTEVATAKQTGYSTTDPLRQNKRYKY